MQVAEASHNFWWVQVKHTAPFKECSPLSRLVSISTGLSISTRLLTTDKNVLLLTKDAMDLHGNLGAGEGRGRKKAKLL